MDWAEAVHQARAVFARAREEPVYLAEGGRPVLVVVHARVYRRLLDRLDRSAAPAGVDLDRPPRRVSWVREWADLDEVRRVFTWAREAPVHLADVAADDAVVLVAAERYQALLDAWEDLLDARDATRAWDELEDGAPTRPWEQVRADMEWR